MEKTIHRNKMETVTRKGLSREVIYKLRPKDKAHEICGLCNKRHATCCGVGRKGQQKMYRQAIGICALKNLILGTQPHAECRRANKQNVIISEP